MTRHKIDYAQAHSNCGEGLRVRLSCIFPQFCPDLAIFNNIIVGIIAPPLVIRFLPPSLRCFLLLLGVPWKQKFYATESKTTFQHNFLLLLRMDVVIFLLGGETRWQNEWNIWFPRRWMELWIDTKSSISGPRIRFESYTFMKTSQMSSRCCCFFLVNDLAFQLTSSASHSLQQVIVNVFGINVSAKHKKIERWIVFSFGAPVMSVWHARSRRHTRE